MMENRVDKNLNIMSDSFEALASIAISYIPIEWSRIN
jgi:hypothetical protein